MILDRFDAANLLRSAAAIGQGGGASTGERMAVPLKLANCALVLLVALDREAAEDRRDDLAMVRHGAARFLRGLLKYGAASSDIPAGRTRARLAERIETRSATEAGDCALCGGCGSCRTIA